MGLRTQTQSPTLAQPFPSLPALVYVSPVTRDKHNIMCLILLCEGRVMGTVYENTNPQQTSNPRMPCCWPYSLLQFWIQRGLRMKTLSTVLTRQGALSQQPMNLSAGPLRRVGSFPTSPMLHRSLLHLGWILITTRSEAHFGFSKVSGRARPADSHTGPLLWGNRKTGGKHSVSLVHESEPHSLSFLVSRLFSILSDWQH